MDIIHDSEFMQRLLAMDDEEIYQSILTKIVERGEL